MAMDLIAEGLLVSSLTDLASHVNEWAQRKGWNEGVRHGNPPSDKIGDAGFNQVEEELADTIIRIAHFAGQRKLRLGEAVIAKLAYNEKRPYKHGKLA